MDLTTDQIGAIVSGILTIIGAFSVTAAALPMPKKPWAIALRKVIDVCAVNIANAKNEKQP
jgi:hypothetical protein